jgi:transcriptional regulator with XRE-family HTH domain
MNQQEFAKALRLDQAHLSKLERGERLPSWHTLRRIARATSGPQETYDLLLLS